MNSFVYDIPVKACFGENRLQHPGTELIKYGKQVLSACDALVGFNPFVRQNLEPIIKMRLECREVV